MVKLYRTKEIQRDCAETRLQHRCSQPHPSFHHANCTRVGWNLDSDELQSHSLFKKDLYPLTKKIPTLTWNLNGEVACLLNAQWKIRIEMRRRLPLSHTYISHARNQLLPKKKPELVTVYHTSPSILKKPRRFLYK